MMGQFREGHIDILVATDLAARGIDVKEISYVVNYHLPEFYDMYVHRTGRTARAGKTGYALTVLQQEEVAEIPEFEEELGITFSAFAKASPQEIADNNLILWARKIFKTKPNRELSPELREKVHKVFHHLTKEELIDKLLARQTS
jgi:ATP-dependent RNA helicase DeaD